ncbi:MAG: hypothetical protein LUF32_08360 [Clostridiales bacterium]|nr:hypothetical protein [Clostridiales bacterium]
MKIRILDRRTLEEVSRKPFNQNTMLISISDFKKQIPCLENIPDYCLFLHFDDLNVPESRPAIHETDSSYFSRKFSWFQAQKIAGFVKKYLYEVDDIICQCEYGVSRSAAVAAAISEYTEGCGKDIFNDLKYHPNPGVYTMTLAALEQDNMSRKYPMPDVKL